MEIEDKDFSNKYKYFNYKNNKICMIFEEHNSLSGHTRWDFDFFILNNQNRIIQINSLKHRTTKECIFSEINEFLVLVNKDKMSPS